MIRLLAFLWSGCWHTWEIHREVTLLRTPTSTLPSGTRYELRCTKCGDMKQKEMRS